MVVDRELEGLLREGLQGELDYYVEPLDTDRFTHEDYAIEFGEFLRTKYRSHHLDAVMTFGDFARDFAVANRERLFRGSPVVFYSLTPPRGAIPGATGVINPIRFRSSLEFCMALQPELKHVFVVSGASASDKVYERQAREEFLELSRGIDFVYLSGLATGDLERRLRSLPPQSAVFYVLVTRDGAGANFEQMRYLSRVAAAANAPTYSWVNVDVDVGIVGGRRRDQVAEVRTAAGLALRVLRGERAEDVPVETLQTDVFAADWRQLRRWGLSEHRLPAGTRVMFREPTIWEQYRRSVIAAVALIVAQSVLIGGLLIQRRKRRLAELKIRHLGRRLLGVQDEERARVARELHDDISQQLAILSIELDAVGAQAPDGVTATVSRAAHTAHGIAASVRALSHHLHPTKLRLLGLVPAIEQLARELSRPHLHIVFSHHGVPPVIEHDVSLDLFRVVQEALSNAVKHSAARQVGIDLTGGPAGVTLTITDDGKGFNVDGTAGDGLGLISMRERVESAGGRLEIRSAPGSGTQVTAVIPTPVLGHSPLCKN